MKILSWLRGQWNWLGLWISMLFPDHGCARPFYWNSGKIADGVWRGPQPNPFHIKGFARKGFKTLVNLRGKTVYGSYSLEKIYAEKCGMKMIDLALYSGAAPRKQQIYALRDVFAVMQKPALLHCKSGADRSGLAAALYLILRENVPVAEAAKQLSRSYGHIKSSKTGILDAFFEKCLADAKARPMPFMQWVEEKYDPAALDAAFERPTYMRALIDFFIRRE
jgi:protein tyrosine/serine phosphatase